MVDNGRALGDLPSRFESPIETYWDIYRQAIRLPRRKWIVTPEWQPKPIPGLESIQRMIEGHVLPREWQLLADFAEALRSGIFHVKNPNWVEPPITAVDVDLRNDTAVAVGATDTDIVSFTVPDRYIAVFGRFGHALTVPAEFGTVVWNIYVNNVPRVRNLDFTQQIGTYVDPTPFSMPITAKHRDIVRVTARTAGAAVSAWARMPGFMFAARTVTQDGSYKDYRSL